MNEHLMDLIARFKRERTYRDAGAASRKTYAEIKAIATAEELVALFEDVSGYTTSEKDARTPQERDAGRGQAHARNWADISDSE